MRVYLLTSLELILRAAIRAFGLAGFSYIEEDSRMAVPEFHTGLFAGTKDAALGVEVFGAEFDGWFHGFKP
jgi:hypothetical protein